MRATLPWISVVMWTEGMRRSRVQYNVLSLRNHSNLLRLNNLASMFRTPWFRRKSAPAPHRCNIVITKEPTLQKPSFTRVEEGRVEPDHCHLNLLKEKQRGWQKKSRIHTSNIDKQDLSRIVVKDGLVISLVTKEQERTIFAIGKDLNLEQVLPRPDELGRRDLRPVSPIWPEQIFHSLLKNLYIAI